MNLQIKCAKLPCDLSWTIYQPIPKKIQNQQPLQQLYYLDGSVKHMIAIVSCNDPQIKNFGQISNEDGSGSPDIKIFSDNQFSVTKNNGVIYYLFNNQKKGYMFAQVNQRIRHCAKLGIFNVSQDIKSGASIRDFVRNDSLSLFKLDQIPSSDFMLDSSIHDVDKDKIIKTSVELKITAENKQKNQRQTLQQTTISPVGKKTTFDFNYIVKKIDTSKYENLQFEFKSTGSVVMLNYIVTPSNRHDVYMGEVTYFYLKADEKILYKLPANPEASANTLAYIYASKTGDSLEVSQKSCRIKEGCQFQIKAKQMIEGTLYLGQQKTQNVQQRIYNELKRSVTRKGKQGDVHLYKTSTTDKKAFQIVVNSPNVIIYTASQTFCRGESPSKKCYEKVLNYHHPSIYEPSVQGTTGSDNLLISIQVLDNCQYTLTRMNEDQQYIALKDGQSFSYLMDDHEDQVIFKFKVDKNQLKKHKSKNNQGVNFNLISPLNSLYLLVQNSQKLPNSKQMNIASTDGFINFSGKQIENDIFTIMILKQQQHHKKFVHFTLIASTDESNLKLQSGIAHYETIQAEQHRDFAFQFQPQEEYIISFYVSNAKAKQKISLQLLVSNKDQQWSSVEDKHSFIIDRQSDVLQLKDVSQSLCQQTQGQDSCEIFIRIINPMDMEVDLTLNLMVKNSIIELKDGIWESYLENAIATSSNFYFYPKHANKTIQIMYKSVFTDLRISYALWKADDKNINPTEWPFPTVKTLLQQQKLAKENNKANKQHQIKLYKPTKHISIDHQALKQCWPSCVVLISLIKNSTEVKGQFSNSNFNLQNGQFSIMISNSYIQIPQKTKVDIALKQNQTKYFMIDLKYALQKQNSALTVFTYTTIGYYQLTGNVYSQRNPRCPGQQDEGDFKFGNVQTQIKVETIYKRLQQNQMTDDRNIYICVLAKAYTHTKMAIQYTSQQQIIKVLDMDSFETVTIDNKVKQRIFQVSANQQYYLKFTRTKGFPFVDITKCQQGKDYQQCLQKFQQIKHKGKQILSKTQSFTQQPCPKCIVFIKISSEQPAEIDIHLQSKYTEMELKENQIVTDFTNEGQQNRYIITALRQQETIINIQVTQGDIQVHITDFNVINIQRKSDKVASQKSNKENKLVHIIIPSQDHKKGGASANRDGAIKGISSLMGLSWMSSFGLSDTFSYLHMTIKSSNGKGATAYSITYSSGQRQTYLQDGLISDYVLDPAKKTQFYYENKNSQGHAYLYLSMTNSADLHNLQLNIYYLADDQDQSSAVQIAADKPPMRKKTPNPTILFSLPAQKFFIFKLRNPSSTEQIVQIGINHQEVMLLPFSHEFPFALHKKQAINFLVDVNNPGYLKLSLKKCDQSNPQFSYTFDYDGFQKSQFEYSTQLNDDPHFEYFIKVKQIGTLYVNFQSQQDDDSLLSIEAEYSAQKIKANYYKPGNKGMIQYQLLDSATAQLTLTQVVCQGKQSQDCSKHDFDYYTISAVKEQDLYTQTVCPTHYFAMVQTSSIDPLPLTKINEKADSNGKIIFKYLLLDHVSYVGVKGINKKTAEEIYYRPVQIVTIWGQISRTSTSHKFTIIAISVVVLLALLICVRRNARKGYKPLQQQD